MSDERDDTPTPQADGGVVSAVAWVMVPAEPTEEMLKAYWQQTGESHEMRQRTEAYAKRYYAAMIAAAPPLNTGPAVGGGGEKPEPHGDDAFACEYDGSLVGHEDYTVLWDKGVRWVQVARSGKITVGQSPSPDRLCRTTSWQELFAAPAEAGDNLAGLSAAATQGEWEVWDVFAEKGEDEYPPATKGDLRIIDRQSGLCLGILFAGYTYSEEMRRMPSNAPLIVALVNAYRSGRLTPASRPAEQGEPVARDHERFAKMGADGRADIPDDYEAEIPNELFFVRGRVKHPAPAASRPAADKGFAIGQRVRKVSGSSWQGTVVGFYSTDLTPDGICVESEREPGSVQIYPAKALALLNPLDDTRAGGASMTEDSRDSQPETRATLVNTGTPNVASPHSGD